MLDLRFCELDPFACDLHHESRELDPDLRDVHPHCALTRVTFAFCRVSSNSTLDLTPYWQSTSLHKTCVILHAKSRTISEERLSRDHTSDCVHTTSRRMRHISHAAAPLARTVQEESARCVASTRRCAQKVSIHFVRKDCF